MRYQYRIIKKESDKYYIIEKRQVGFFGYFWGWNEACVRSDLDVARDFCKNAIRDDLLDTRIKVLEVFKP